MRARSVHLRACAHCPSAPEYATVTQTSPSAEFAFLGWNAPRAERIRVGDVHLGSETRVPQGRCTILWTLTIGNDSLATLASPARNVPGLQEGQRRRQGRRGLSHVACCTTVACVYIACSTSHASCCALHAARRQVHVGCCMLQRQTPVVCHMVLLCGACCRFSVASWVVHAVRCIVAVASTSSMKKVFSAPYTFDIQSSRYLRGTHSTHSDGLLTCCTRQLHLGLTAGCWRPARSGAHAAVPMRCARQRGCPLGSTSAACAACVQG